MMEKRIKQLSEYIRQVEQGKRAMIMGDDYIVMSKSIYKTWVKMMEVTGNNPLDYIDDALINGEAEKSREYDEEVRKDGKLG